jgi:hypothetical protein
MVPRENDLGVMIFGDVGNSDRLFMDIFSDIERVGLVND